MGIKASISQLLDVPSTDPDNQRRSRLLNILLLGVGALDILAMIASFAFADWVEQEGATPGYGLLMQIATVILLLVVIGIWFLNRRWPTLASTLFLLIVTGMLFLSDSPREVVAGRTQIAMAIPVVMASVLLRPYASFLIAVVINVMLAGISLQIGLYPNPYSTVVIFTYALVSWLSAQAIERVLRDLRTLNLELDQRVRDRTRELAESLSKTEAILDSTADGIIVFDNADKATVANPAVAGLLAHPAEKIVGRDLEALMGSYVSPGDKEMIGTLLHGEGMQEPSVKFKWGKKMLSASVAPVRLESGEEIGTVAVFRDFTREAEIDRMKSTFVSIASHELRTPLNAILGYSEMLNEGVYDNLTPRQSDAVGRVLANTHHMLGLANNLLDRAQIEAGTLKLSVVSFPPKQLVEQAVAVTAILAKNKGLELMGEVAHDMPKQLMGDQQRLSQIVVNLIGNAVKFTSEGGVKVRAYMVDEMHWALAVTDTGIGISEEAFERIFEPFRQADESVTREHGGAGLGLSIVKQLAEMMGGTVAVQSEVGKGSTFTVTLPLTPPDNEFTLGETGAAISDAMRSGETKRP
jgi:PAS domain S-box-containing protein